MTNRRELLLQAAGLGASAMALSLPVRAQSAWPGDKPVKIVVPYPAGGTVDWAARQLAAQLGKQTGGTFVVENRAGASGIIGTAYVATSPADGHTVIALDTSYAMRPATFKELAYDTDRSFTPLSPILQDPVALVVSADSPFRTAKDLFDAARSRPGQLRYGSGGVGSSIHLFTELLQSEGKFKLFHVPYKGGGEVTLAIMGGHLDLYTPSVPGVMAHIKANKLRALAVSGTKRLPQLPNVPLFSEVGLPYAVQDWIGIALPRATPKHVVDAFHAQIVAATKDEGFRQLLEQQGAEAVSMTPAAFDKFIKDQVRHWTDTARSSGVAPV